MVLLSMTGAPSFIRRVRDASLNRPRASTEFSSTKPRGLSEAIAVSNSSEESANDGALCLSTTRAGPREMRFALIAILISSVIFAVAVPFAKTALTQIPAFIPIYVTALIVSDVMTAVLLFNEYAYLRSRALLIIASGYVFTASITAAYTIIFPGLFSSSGLFGAGPQTTSAMYMFWHAGFPLFVMVYAFCKDRVTEAPIALAPTGRRASVPILISTACVMALVLGFTLAVTVGQEHVPVFLQNNVTSDLGRVVLLAVWVLSLFALIVLLLRPPHTVIDIWLMSVMCVWLFDIALSAILNTGRYDLGWYVGRIYGLLGASFVLVIILIENGKYHTRLARMSARLSEANRDLETLSLRTEDDLRRYRGLLEAAPDAMVVVGQGGEISLLNAQAEKQFGYRRDELLGRLVQTIIPEGFAERLIADDLRSTEDALTQQIGAGIELRGLRKDGSMFPMEIMLSPMEGAEGVLVTAAIRDITRRKKTEAALFSNIEELKRSNEELEQFSYVASHDLQEPLRMVSSYMQLLSKRYKGQLDADADGYIAFAVDGASRMQRLIKDLLTYSRVGSQGGSFAEVSADTALHHALANLQMAIRDSGAVVTHEALPTVLADGAQLTQLFQNLVGNAIKYRSAAAPEVHISAAKSDNNRWKFSVRDNGLGIAPQYFEKIFGMFQRLHKRGEFDGTGIGLAICKKIVERHGGSLTVESQPGRGSSFKFTLSPARVVDAR